MPLTKKSDSRAELNIRLKELESIATLRNHHGILKLIRRYSEIKKDCLDCLLKRKPYKHLNHPEDIRGYVQGFEMPFEDIESANKEIINIRKRLDELGEDHGWRENRRRISRRKSSRR